MFVYVRSLGGWIRLGQKEDVPARCGSELHQYEDYCSGDVALCSLACVPTIRGTSSDTPQNMVLYKRARTVWN
jgi:hypothetical protein